MTKQKKRRIGLGMEARNGSVPQVGVLSTESSHEVVAEEAEMEVVLGVAQKYIATSKRLVAALNAQISDLKRQNARLKAELAAAKKGSAKREKTAGKITKAKEAVATRARTLEKIGDELAKEVLKVPFDYDVCEDLAEEWQKKRVLQ